MALSASVGASYRAIAGAPCQQSSGSLASLARQFGVSSRTVARWKSRAEVQDRSHVLHRLSTTMTAWEEALVVELCRSL